MTPIILFLFISMMPISATAGFDVDSLPKIIAPMSWNMSNSDIENLSAGAEIQGNNYNAIYFGKLIKVDAVIIASVKFPKFDDAQVTIEKFNGKTIGVRVDTTDVDSNCWNDTDRPNNCRRDDFKGLQNVFCNVLKILEKQYGPGVRKKGDSNGEQSIQWTSKQGQLILYLQKGKFDGWYVGLWIARR